MNDPNKPFHEKTPEELDEFARETAARTDVDPRHAAHFARKIQLEANRRRWRRTLETERARRARSD